MEAPNPSQHHPAPTLCLRAPLPLLPVHNRGATLGLAPVPRDRTASQPPHTEVLAKEPALPTILSILATAGLQRQSQAGVTPCHSTSPSPPPWQWQQAQGAAFLSLPLAAHKRAGGIQTYVTLLAADAPGISDGGEQREPGAAPGGAAVAL